MLKLSKLTWQPPEGGQIIKGMDLAIPDGKLVVLTGPNGGGKTTLAKLIAGTLSSSSGEVAVGARPGTRGPAVVLVSHRASTMKIADEVRVM